MQFRWPLVSVLGVIVVVLCNLTVTARAESQLGDVLDAWETSAESLRSYDVYLHVEALSVMKAVVVGKRTSKGKAPPGTKPPEEPIIELRERPPGEQPGRYVQFSRQVLSKEGKRRYELWNPESRSWISASVFDGEIVRSMTQGGVTTASIRGRGPDTKNLSTPERNYAGLFRDMTFGGSIFTVLRSRRGVRLVQGSGDNTDYVHVESLPEEGDYYPNFGLRIALDPLHAMMPVEIKVFRGTMKAPHRRISIEEFFEVEPGVWAPVKATHDSLDAKGRIITAVHLAADMDRSNWNQPVSEELFTLVIPEGTGVVDRVRNVAFMAGEGDTGKNLDRLIENARNVIPTGPPTGAGNPRSSSRTFLLIGINALALAVILGILYARARRRRAPRRARK